MRPPLGLSLAAFALSGACGPGAAPEPLAWLQGTVVAIDGLEPAATAVADLRWHVPDPECPQVYVIDVSYDNPPMNEADSRSTLELGLPTLEGHRSSRRPGPPLPGEVVAAVLHYQGNRVGKAGARRDVHLSDRTWGPAAPTAACYERSWDPMEDALALGMPELPGRPTAVGETWHGARIGGRCNRTACVDPVDRQGGLAHHLSCVTMPFQETLLGVYRAGDARLAAIESRWHDGHGVLGIHTERQMLLDLDHGRPVWSRVRIHHEFLAVQRTFEMAAIDTCPGSPATMGARLDPELVARAEEGARAFAVGSAANRGAGAESGS